MSSESVNSVPVPDEPWLRLYVLWPPRAVSFIWYEPPDPDVPMVTLPLYWLLPVPLLTPWNSKSFSPVFASVMTCSWLGVPSSWRPPTTVSYARVGVPFAAQITLRGALSALVFFEPCAFADATADFSTADGATAALVVATRTRAFVALATDRSLPLLVSSTTRSPPSTGSPSYVRSYRVCTVPLRSWVASRTTSFSLAPRPRVLAVSALVASASLSSAARCAGESLTGCAPGSALAITLPPAADASSGRAEAEPACTPTAIMAPAATRAPVAMARRWGVRLTLTPSAVAATGGAADGDRAAGWSPGQIEAEQMERPPRRGRSDRWGRAGRGAPGVGGGRRRRPAGDMGEPCVNRGKSATRSGHMSGA